MNDGSIDGSDGDNAARASQRPFRGGPRGPTRVPAESNTGT